MISTVRGAACRFFLRQSDQFTSFRKVWWRSGQHLLEIFVIALACATKIRSASCCPVHTKIAINSSLVQMNKSIRSFRPMLRFLCGSANLPTSTGVCCTRILHKRRHPIDKWTGAPSNGDGAFQPHNAPQSITAQKYPKLIFHPIFLFTKWNNSRNPADTNVSIN